ncbi:hypothetical protein [Streptomyces zaomyceticus]|uniref:hypothetical protein n=1 Tax=Streptomyces zaomyceticus TaxID=68286 RepID=UPI00167BF537|nr:hypothetical protein [Streptomyces zaomyceticus]GHG39060.1 hypothetical protein GCM10018791_66300 [Streptomyces zaomyceticus]
MTPHNELRLLPWSSPDGKPCYLSTDSNDGPVSRLADTTEAAQLEAGQELLEHAMEVMADAESDPAELRVLARDLTETLRDTLRVAVSRGHRLPTLPSAVPGEEDAAPRLPAAAFG